MWFILTTLLVDHSKCWFIQRFPNKIKPMWNRWMRFLIPVNNPNDYPHKPKRLLFNITKKSPPETQNKAFLSFPVGNFYYQKRWKWLFYAKKRITEIVSFQLSLFGRGRRTWTLGTRFWSGSDRVLSENTPKFLLIFNINQYSEFVDNA